jgi:hypothetical protein
LGISHLLLRKRQNQVPEKSGTAIDLGLKQPRLFVDPKRPTIVFALCFVTLRREEIDWAGLRAAAVAIGIRRAARQAAHDLPPDEQERFVQRAMKRCSRQKWLIKSQQDKADAVSTSPTALSANVRKGSDVLSEVLAEDSRATRIGLSAAARKAAETLAKMPGSKVIKHAQAHRHVTASSSVLHGWDDKGNLIPFTLNVLSINSLELDTGGISEHGISRD